MKRYVADHHSFPIEFVRGDGCFLFDTKGRKYLDFLGGWCVATVGWRNKEMEKAISREAKKGMYVPPVFRHPEQEAVAERLVSMAPGKLRRVYRCTSGSEAVEFAIKCARASSGKPTIVTIDGVYHGHTYGAGSLGDACTDEVGPCLPGFIKLPMPKSEQEGTSVIEKFEKLLKSRKDIAAFMSEPVWTNAGCYIPPRGFYEGIQRVCRKYNVLLVMDEVATGIGRCGRMFASELWELEPDILCLGKSFTGGYATMGATMVTEHVFSRCKKVSDYSTFGWLPQDLAATAQNIEIIVRDNLANNAAEIGSYMLTELKGLEKLRKVKEVRGIGMVFGIEFYLPIALIMAARCYRKKLLVAEANAHTLFFSPPLILSKKLAQQGIEILKNLC